MSDDRGLCKDCGYWQRAHNTCTCPCVSGASSQSIDLGAYPPDRPCNCLHFVDKLLALAQPERVALPAERCVLCWHWDWSRDTPRVKHLCSALNVYTAPLQQCRDHVNSRFEPRVKCDE